MFEFDLSLSKAVQYVQTGREMSLPLGLPPGLLEGRASNGRGLSMSRPVTLHTYENTGPLSPRTCLPAIRIPTSLSVLGRTCFKTMNRDQERPFTNFNSTGQSNEALDIIQSLLNQHRPLWVRTAEQSPYRDEADIQIPARHLNFASMSCNDKTLTTKSDSATIKAPTSGSPSADAKIPVIHSTTMAEMTRVFGCSHDHPNLFEGDTILEFPSYLLSDAGQKAQAWVAYCVNSKDDGGLRGGSGG